VVTFNFEITVLFLCSSVGLYSINRLSKKNVEDLLGILRRHCGDDQLSKIDAKEISEEYNQELLFRAGKDFKNSSYE
jgi:hypothetical protein